MAKKNFSSRLTKVIIYGIICFFGGTIILYSSVLGAKIGSLFGPKGIEWGVKIFFWAGWISVVISAGLLILNIAGIIFSF